MPHHDDIRKLLIIEDDLGLAKQLGWHFSGMQVFTAADVDSALAIVRAEQPQVILQDLGLPPDAQGVSEGFRCIEAILDIQPNSKILVMTGKSEEANALRAIGLGAIDFFHKPVDPDTLDLIVNRCFETHRLRAMNCRDHLMVDDLVGEIRTQNPEMMRICRSIKKLAGTEITCTLMGESGVGKDIFANAIHRHSPRKDRRFQAINCAAIPENLIESELFGYEKGAFTGAAKQTAGKIECADGGTLFLDEIGDMPLLLQTKLLRFLQQRTIQRVGSTHDIAVDVRVVCATNKRLKSMVSEGSFREDLYYRICEFEVEIPPLRARGGDRLILADYFLAQTIDKYHLVDMQGFSAAARAALLTYDWPGNVRELESKIKTAAVMSDNPLITLDDLNLEGVAGTEATEVSDGCVNGSVSLREARKLAEVSAITSALDKASNITEAAKILKISRPTLYDMMTKYQLEQPG
ncbi:PEP-CTERM-box response regulator transcription factor [Litorivicinus lipolyticus]|uniref:PEP-CTERM-box response regulator transcription factor n=1 Tax=Litorivicinus lipolyticus TaxID=418701 RepID=UPI003B5CEF03